MSSRLPTQDLQVCVRKWVERMPGVGESSCHWPDAKRRALTTPQRPHTTAIETSLLRIANCYLPLIEPLSGGARIMLLDWHGRLASLALDSATRSTVFGRTTAHSRYQRHGEIVKRS